MRKWGKTVCIIAVALVTAIFTLCIPPKLPMHIEVLPDETVDPVFCISPYDSIFRVYADTIGWDWKMLAAVAYVESKFDTSAVSSVGAQGLMQIMPVTARAMGIPEGMEHDPEESVRAAVEYFEYLSHVFRRVPEEERINFD